MLIVKVCQGPPLKKEVESAIRKDTLRTLTSAGAENRSSLSNVLKIYALSNPVVGYCQGMSFIAEFLLVHLKSEALTFAFLSATIDRYGMCSLFADGLPLLRAFLYQLDRLLYFQHSSLALSLLSEGMAAAHFASPWFMSLFTFMLKEEGNEELVGIWDAFVLYGWKAIFRAGMYAVRRLNKTEQTMELVKELTAGAAFKDSVEGARFIDEFKKIPVTREILELLSREYNKIMKFGQTTK